VKLNSFFLFALTAMTLTIFTIGCSDRDPTKLEVGRATIDPVVYDDDLSEDVYFQPFFETHYTAMSQDSVYAYDGFAPDGDRSLKFNVPAPGSALGPYMGGVLTSAGARDLADFNALTFYARSDAPISMNSVGFGNDNTGNSLYEVSRDGSPPRNQLPLTGDWQFFVVPIPAPSKLISERGMFLIAEGAEDGYPEGYDIWIDEIKFARLSNMEWTRSSMGSDYQTVFVGSEVTLGSAYTNFKVNGQTTRVDHSPNYFDYTASDSVVVSIERGVITAIGTGLARITGTLENQEDPQNPHEAVGFADIDVIDPPTEAALPPTAPAGDVISMFSDVYTDVLIDTWLADWENVTTQLSNYVIGGDNSKMYSNLNWVGVEFFTRPINASSMNNFHIDVYAPVGTEFKFFLVSFPDGSPDGIPTQEFVLNADSTPAFAAGQWVAIDIPLTDLQPEDPNFDWSSLSQMVFESADAWMVLVDNVYFRK